MYFILYSWHYFIILLNILGKLIEKSISERLQIYSIALNFVYLNQLEDIKQQSTLDAELYLTHLIHAGWIKESMLAFNIAQFFPSLNHQLLLSILDKAGFNPRISTFFSSYLVNRQTQYIWNNFISLFSKADIDMSQGSALWYFISPLFFIFSRKELIVFYIKCKSIL